MGTENKSCTHSVDCNYKCNGVSEYSTKGSEDSVPNIPVTVDSNNVTAGALEILKHIRPSWNQDAIKFKFFTDGITNKLVGCFNIDNSKDDATKNDSKENDLTSIPTSNVVLVRVFGNKTELLIDRKAEARNIKMLHKYGFAPSLYAVFNNGLAYEYVPGVTLTPETIMKPKVWNLIARRMAEMHKVNYDDMGKREPMLWSKTNQFLDLLPDVFGDPNKLKRLENTFISVQHLRDEFTALYKQLESLKSPVVFSHNDLLLGNVIYSESQNKVTFIDYEYADCNFQAFDIGNHFTEFAGIDEVDYSRYPKKDYQMKWLRAYLETYLETTTVNQDDINRLYVQVNQFALSSHFLWSVWSLIQSHHSNIDFDFVTFAEIRYNEYLAKRDMFLSLKENNL